MGFTMRAPLLSTLALPLEEALLDEETLSLELEATLLLSSELELELELMDFFLPPPFFLLRTFFHLRGMVLIYRWGWDGL